MHNTYIIAGFILAIIVAAVLVVTEVQKASTIHNTILSNTAEVQRFTADNQADIAGLYDGEVEIESNKPFTVLNLYICDVNIGTTDDVSTGDTLKLIDIEIDNVPLTDMSDTTFPDITIDDALFSGTICVDLLDVVGWSQLSALGEIDFILDERDDDAEDDGDGMDITAVLLLPSVSTVSVSFGATD